MGRGADRRTLHDERSLAASVAGALAPAAFFQCAKDCIQVLGGIGFTWEHDAHLYLKRATAMRALTGGGPHPWRRRTLALAARAACDARWPSTFRPRPNRSATRSAPTSIDIRAHDKTEWRGLLADGGYLAPHWPKPWGRDANAVEQLVIDEEMRAAHIRRHHLAVGAWVLPTLIEHGTDEQQQRWIPPTLRGELAWCQLFSEPGAGSDLASLSMKASRVEGGWLLTGQKVWTSMAREADWGLCLARTDPSVPKHEGITSFCVDMSSEGIDIRPLRELTGFAMFNEVFLSDVFVPDDCVVGAVDDGWRAARTTLANERVSMGSGSSFGFGVEMLLGVVDDERRRRGRRARRVARRCAVARRARPAHDQPGVERRRSRAPSRASASCSASSTISGCRRSGSGCWARQGAANDRDAASWVGAFFANRCLTIAGGTSEVQRNVIAERLLGLPKD